MKVKDQLSTSGCLETTEPDQPVLIGGLLEDEDDDDVGIADDDVLVTLNYEAFQKMNSYAHLISPVPSGGPGDLLDAPSGQTPFIRRSLLCTDTLCLLPAR